MNSKNGIQQNFITGDIWVYYKIYTGYKSADQLLTKVIGPNADKLKKKNIIDKWFYIRYNDPKFHLRVRFKSRSLKDVGAVLTYFLPFFEEYINMDIIWRIQTDTYKREIDRYGSNTMELAEEYFYHDSKMMVSFLDIIKGEEGNKLRWLFGLRAIDSLLDSFNFSIIEKRDFLSVLNNGFLNEFGNSKNLRRQLGDKFRIERDKIEEFMNIDLNHNRYNIILSLLEHKECSIEKIAQDILKHRELQTLQVKLNDLLASYIHMLMNRLFKSQNRKHELVCYDMLYRFYKSKIAREKKALPRLVQNE